MNGNTHSPFGRHWKEVVTARQLQCSFQGGLGHTDHGGGGGQGLTATTHCKKLPGPAEAVPLAGAEQKTGDSVKTKSEAAGAARGDGEGSGEGAARGGHGRRREGSGQGEVAG